MRSVIIIPARYQSSRFPGKPLSPLIGATGQRKSLIERSYEAACAVGNIDAIYVATDDARIAEACAGFGADVLMTSEACRNGTERCAEALAALPEAPDLVVNLQGDAPLTPPWFIEELVQHMTQHPDAGVATPVLRCERDMVARFKEDRAAGRVGGTTAVFDRHGQALYFSKEVLPFCDGLPDDMLVPVFHHVGVYAYRPSALDAYMAAEESLLERLEGLEQLRFLVEAIRLDCVEVEARGAEFWELNNPVDTARIEAVLKHRNVP